MSERVNIDDTRSGFVSPSAVLDTNVIVDEDARVEGEARLTNGCQIKDRALVRGKVGMDSACARDDAIVADEANMRPHSCVTERAVVFGRAQIGYGTHVFGDARIGGKASIPAGCEITGHAWIMSRYHYAGGDIGIYHWDAYLAWDPKKPGYYVNLRFACQTMRSTCWTQAKRNYWAVQCDPEKPLFWSDVFDRLMGFRDGDATPFVKEDVQLMCGFAEKAIIIPDAMPDFASVPTREAASCQTA